MHAALVGEGAAADVGLVVAQGQVGQFGDKPGDARQAGKLLGAHRSVPHLEFEVGDDRAEVGVAGPFPVAVHAALDMGSALLDGSERVGDGEVGVVVSVDADDAAEPADHLARERGDFRGDGAAIGVAQAENIRAGVLRGFERAQGEVGIRLVAVEEVLRVVDDFLAVLPDVGHGFRDDRQVLFLGDAEGALGVQVPAFAEDGDDGGAGLHKLLDARVRLHRMAGETGGAESGKPGVLEFEIASPGKELAILGI